MKWSNTVKTYLESQDYRVKWIFTYFHIDFLVTTSGIESLQRNLDYQSMVVYLNATTATTCTCWLCANVYIFRSDQAEQFNKENTSVYICFIF